MNKNNWIDFMSFFVGFIGLVVITRILPPVGKLLPWVTLIMIVSGINFLVKDPESKKMIVLFTRGLSIPVLLYTIYYIIFIIPSV